MGTTVTPVPAGDVSQRVGVEVIRARGVDVEKLIKMLIANAAAEFASTYYYYTILRMHLAGYEDYKEICEDARLEDRAHWELIVPRIYELGGELPNDLPEFHNQAGCAAAAAESVACLRGSAAPPAPVPAPASRTTTAGTPCPARAPPPAAHCRAAALPRTNRHR